MQLCGVVVELSNVKKSPFASIEASFYVSFYSVTLHIFSS